jgi:uncharacterized lipoprotein YbaY
VITSESSVFGGGGVEEGAEEGVDDGAEEGVDDGVGEGVDDGVGEGEKKVEEEDVGHGFVAGQSIVLSGKQGVPPCFAGVVTIYLCVIVEADKPQPDGHDFDSSYFPTQSTGHCFVAGQSIVLSGKQALPPCFAGVVTIYLCVIVEADKPQPDGHDFDSSYFPTQSTGHCFVAGQSIVLSGKQALPPCFAGVVTIYLCVIVEADKPQSDGHGFSFSYSPTQSTGAGAAAAGGVPTHLQK